MNIFRRKYNQFRFFFGKGYKIIVDSDKIYVAPNQDDIQADILKWFKDNNVKYKIQPCGLPISLRFDWIYLKQEIQFQYKEDAILFKLTML